jgi:hypothetical protein
MRQYDRRRIAMLERVRDFGTRYGHLFSGLTIAREAFDALTRAVAEIEACDAAERTAAAMRHAARKQHARRALVQRMRLMARTVRVLPDAEPAFKAHFRIPGPGYDLRMLAAGRTFSHLAATCPHEFIARGMPPTFLADFNALLERFAEALRSRRNGQNEAAAAQARIKVALAAGFAATARLDIVVANHLRNDPITREVWAHTRRIGHPPRDRSAGDSPRYARGRG